MTGLTGCPQQDLLFSLLLGVPPRDIFNLHLMPVCFYHHDGQSWSGALCCEQSWCFNPAYYCFSNAFMNFLDNLFYHALLWSAFWRLPKAIKERYIKWPLLLSLLLKYIHFVSLWGKLCQMVPSRWENHIVLQVVWVSTSQQAEKIAFVVLPAYHQTKFHFPEPRYWTNLAYLSM